MTTNIKVELTSLESLKSRAAQTSQQNREERAGIEADFQEKQSALQEGLQKLAKAEEEIDKKLEDVERLEQIGTAEEYAKLNEELAAFRRSLFRINRLFVATQGPQATSTSSASLYRLSVLRATGYFTSRQNGYTQTWYVYSQDGSQSLPISITASVPGTGGDTLGSITESENGTLYSSRSTTNFGYRAIQLSILDLPVGRDVAIRLCVARACANARDTSLAVVRYPGESYSNYGWEVADYGATLSFAHRHSHAYDKYAFLVGKTSIRQVPIPSRIDNLLEVYAPPPALATVTENVGWATYEGASMVLPPSEFTYTRDIAYDTMDMGSHGYTVPDIFKRINDFSTFTSAPLKSEQEYYEQYKHYIVPYEKDKGYKLLKDDEGWDLDVLTHGADYGAFFYQLNKHEDPLDRESKLIMEKRLSTRSSRTMAAAGAELPPPFQGSSPYADMAYVWDWNRPRYCRDLLLELGFTIKDLTPVEQ